MLPLPNEPELFSLEEVLLIERLTLDSTLEPAIPELEPILPLPARDDVRAMAVGVLEYARTDFGGYAPVADEIMFGETPARNAEHGCGVDGVVLRFVELQCKPSEKGACSFFRGAVRDEALRCTVSSMQLTNLAKIQNLLIGPRCHELPKFAFERGLRESLYCHTFPYYSHQTKK